MKYDETYWVNKIDDIMNHFDFTRVHKTMEVLDWGWCSDAPPDVDEMRDTSKRLLCDSVKDALKDGKYHFQGTGGFDVEIYPERGVLKLRFVVEECHAEEECVY
jgi:hypothetical protein